MNKDNKVETCGNTEKDYQLREFLDCAFFAIYELSISSYNKHEVKVINYKFSESKFYIQGNWFYKQPR